MGVATRMGIATRMGDMSTIVLRTLHNLTNTNLTSINHFNLAMLLHIGNIYW
jgi:hypothetical protein